MLGGVIVWVEGRVKGRLRVGQPGAYLVAYLSSTRTPPRLDHVLPAAPASVSPHMTAPTRTVPHPTTRPASVARSDVLQVQACVVRNLSTPVTLHHRVFKQMAAQQTMKRVSAAQVRAVLPLDFTATHPIISVLDHHAQPPMDQKPTLLNYASVEISLAMSNLVSSASRRCRVVLVERRIQVVLVTLK